MKKGLITLLGIVEFNIGVNVIGLPIFYVHKKYKEQTVGSRFFGNGKRQTLKIESYYTF